MSELVVYDEKLANFQKEFEESDTEEIIIDETPQPRPRPKRNDDRPVRKESSPDLQTSLIDALRNECEKASNDYDKFRNPEYTGRHKIDQMIKDDVKDFINRRCESYATNIETIINSLIKHHDFPEELFDNYVELARFVRMYGGEQRSVEYLYQLTILGKGVLPREVYYTKTNIITPVLDSQKDMGV